MKRFLKHFLAMTLAAALCVGIAPQRAAAVGQAQTDAPMLGDVNGDGAVNGKDVTALQRYLAGGYGTEIDSSASNVNADKLINIHDVTLLRRYLVGGYGAKLGKQSTNFDENSTPLIPAP